MEYSKEEISDRLIKALNVTASCFLILTAISILTRNPTTKTVVIYKEKVRHHTKVVNHYDTVVSYLKDVEKFSSKWYNCSSGNKTIGYGTTLNCYPELKTLSSMSESVATEYLKLEFNKCLDIATNDGIKGTQALAVASFIYNVGVPKYMKSTLRKKAKNKTAIDKEFRKWIYSNGNVMSGLIRRRMKEVEIYHKDGLL